MGTAYRRYFSMAEIHDPSGAGLFRHPGIKGVLIAGVEHSLWHALFEHGIGKGNSHEFQQVHEALVEISGPEPGELEFLALYLYWWVSRYPGRVDEDELYDQFLQALDRHRKQETSAEARESGKS
jgi:hypothetical protein